MARCKGCGAEILWAVTENGKKIPLDAEPETRFIAVMEGGATERDSVRVAKARKTYQSHFATCPEADQFRK